MLRFITVTRLVTYAYLREFTSKTYSVDLRLVARVMDGREILLLDDRGFGGRSSVEGVKLSREQIEIDARTCVGPDAPFDQQTWEQVERQHLELLAERLRTAGLTTSVEELRDLENEVVLDERLQRAVT